MVSLLSFLHASRTNLISLLLDLLRSRDLRGGKLINFSSLHLVQLTLGTVDLGNFLDSQGRSAGSRGLRNLQATRLVALSWYHLTQLFLCHRSLSFARFSHAYIHDGNHCDIIFR